MKAERKNKKNSEKRIRKPIIVICSILFILIALVIVAFIYEKNMIKDVYYIEAGTELNVSDFVDNDLANNIIPVSFAAGMNIPDTSIPGEYELTISTRFFKHKTKLIVNDTIPPIATVKSVSITIGNECEPMDFIESYEDATAVEAAYSRSPNYSRYGEQKVGICLTDAGGNQTNVDSVLFISQVLTDLTVEVGSPVPELADFVVGGENAKFITDMDTVDMNKIGETIVTTLVDGITYNTNLQIVDTEKPVVKFKNYENFVGLEVSPSDFVVKADDRTALTYSFKTDPDTSKVGEQTLVVIVTDEGGNTTKGKVRLTLEVDDAPPYINGVNDVNIYLGDSVAYMAGVYVIDNCKKDLKCDVDYSEVDLSKPGDYTVTYTAEDASGNTSTKQMVVHIKEKKFSEEEVLDNVEYILDRNLTPNMDDYEKCQAIFYCVKNKIEYVSSSDHSSELKGAYDGLVEGKGDSFTFACSIKALLDGLEISNKIVAFNGHYWNIVDLNDNDEWLHIDASSHVDHPIIFMWDDVTLSEYSANHNNSHYYEKG